MIVKKPAIFIYTSEPDREILREICAGIEEEGVFYEIKEQTLVPKDARSTAARFAWQAAQDSMLRDRRQPKRRRLADARTFRRPLR